MTDLRVENISFAYRDKPAIHGISFDARRGEVIGIMGQNGCGKTTLLKCINGSQTPSEGHVFLDDEDTSLMSKRDVARKMAFVMQSANMTFPFTVFETVMMGRYAHLETISRESEEDVSIAYRAMRDTGVLEFRDRRINELSGGERRRVLIARALAQEPEVLLLDEPTLHLDINHQFDLLELVRSLADEKNILVLIVTHDIVLASRYCDRLILMEHGGMMSMDETRKVATEEKFRRAFQIITDIGMDPRFGLDITLVDRDRGVD